MSVGLAVRPAAGPSLCNERPQKPNDHDLHAGRRRRHDRPGAYGWLARDHQAVAKSLRKRWRSSRIVQRLRQTHAPEAIFLQGAPATRQSDGASPRTTAVAARARWRGTECTSWHCGTLDWRSLREPTSADARDVAWGSGICGADALPIGGLPRPQARGDLSRGVWVIYFHVDLAVAPGDRNERRSVDTLANGVAVAQGPQGADHRLQ